MRDARCAHVAIIRREGQLKLRRSIIEPRSARVMKREPRHIGFKRREKIHSRDPKAVHPSGGRSEFFDSRPAGRPAAASARDKRPARMFNR